VIATVVGGIVLGFLAVLLFGLATGRIDWRQQGCCPADPDDDLRMRTDGTPSTGTTTTTRRREP
jgi:hypothetical protein